MVPVNHNNFKKKSAELLVDLVAHIQDELIKNHSFDDEKAEQIAVNTAQMIVKNWGGLILYIPKNMVFALSERDMNIYREFNGYNHAMLAKKYGVSMQWIYKIVKKARKIETMERQCDFFNQSLK